MTESTLWSPTSPGIQLSPSEVHIWRVHLDLDSPISAHSSTFLSETERERVSQFVFAKDRNQFTVSRMVLRQLLGAYLGQRPQNVIIETLEHGKPRVLAAGTYNLTSHIRMDSLCLLFAWKTRLESI